MMEVPQLKTFSHNPEYLRLKGLIDKDDLDSDILEQAISNRLINSDEHHDLAFRLLKMREVIEAGRIGGEQNNKDTIQSLKATVNTLEIDPATGLLRRGALEEKFSDLSRELNPSHREQRETFLHAIVLIAVDLDNLKKWNDYSHSTGDNALKTLATAMKVAAREKDYVFRLGDRSDEFVTLLRIDQDLTDEKLEDIFRKFKNRANSGFVAVEGGEQLPVTAAFGYTVVKPGDKRNIKEIIAEADKNQLADKEPAKKEARIAAAKAMLAVAI